MRKHRQCSRGRNKNGNWGKEEETMVWKYKEITEKEKKLDFIDKVYNENKEKLESELKTHLDNTANINTGEADLDKFEITEIEWSDYNII